MKNNNSFPLGFLSFKLLFLFILVYNVKTTLVIAQNVNSKYSIESSNRDIIYVISNRNVDQSSEDLSFKNDIKKDSNLVFIKVLFHQTDSISNQILEKSEFMNQISSIPANWLLFIHGDSKTYEQSIMRGLAIQRTHAVNVIVFSWPSKDSDINGLKNYKNSKDNVLKSMVHFTELIDFMNSFSQTNNAFKINSNLSMFAHSLGNSFLENFIKDKKNDKKNRIIFDNIIINSAAVNQKLHKNWVEKFNIQKRIYITNNKSDFNLKGAHIFTNDGNQLGEKAKAPLANNASYIQFTEAVGLRFPTGTSHTFFIGEVPKESNNIRKFYFDALHGNQIKLSQSSQFKKRDDKIGYDIIF